MKKTKSLTFKIFINSFLVGTAVLFACVLLFVSNLYSYFERRIFTELENEVEYLGLYAEDSNLERLKSLRTRNRITLIHGDGTVFFDNTVDPSILENHSNRTEFMRAVNEGSVSLSRYSNTMTEKTLYHAKRLSNSDVIRISCDQHSVGVLVFGMGRTLFAMLVVAFTVSAVSANFVSKKITGPINSIDTENPLETNVYEELRPFALRLAEENSVKSQNEESRRQFSANVSHELKTPLTSISGFAEILMGGKTGRKNTVDFSRTIYKESQRMISLVNDIIKLSRLDEKSISRQKEKTSLREITKEVFEVLSESARKKGVRLNLFGDSGILTAVKTVVYEMVYNLVDNAIKYNRQDGNVDVCIETSKYFHNGTGENSKVSISVKDSGIGIAKQDLERIFERFYRVDKSRSKSLGGTGLGLSIVKHGAKYHNAEVYVSSEEGVGSTFTVAFSL